MRRTLIFGALCLSRGSLALPEQTQVESADSLAGTTQQQLQQDATFLHTGQAPPPRVWGAYQSEIFMKGALGSRPTVTMDPNKLEEQARGKLNAKAFGFLNGGSGEHATMDANRAAFKQWKLIPRMLRPGKVDLSIKLFNKTYSTPVLFAPIGFQDILNVDAEPGVASVATELGIPYVLSMSTSATMEDVAKASGTGDRWFQLYWPPSDYLTINLLTRAKENGYSVLVVTVDATTLGWRPVDLDLGYMPNNFNATSGKASPLMPDMASLLSGGALPSIGQLFSAPPSWDRIKFLREHWSGPILLKGIQHVDDAKLAVKYGVDGVIVSNHGGRQLDGGIGSLDALPEIVDAVGDQITVLFDSGVRTGADIIKALALGAKGVLVGRPWAYGMGIAGKDGVRQVMRGLMAQLEINMAIAGLYSVSQVDRKIMRRIRDRYDD
jgi:lactate 2-monooxygenase